MTPLRSRVVLYGGVSQRLSLYTDILCPTYDCTLLWYSRVGLYSASLHVLMSCVNPLGHHFPDPEHLLPIKIAKWLHPPLIHDIFLFIADRKRSSTLKTKESSSSRTEPCAKRSVWTIPSSRGYQRSMESPRPSFLGDGAFNTATHSFRRGACSMIKS